MVNVTSRWSALDYAENAAFVPALGEAVLQLLDPRPGELILDLGCGDGALTARIAEAGARHRRFRRRRRDARPRPPGRAVRPVRRGLLQRGPALDARRRRRGLRHR